LEITKEKRISGATGLVNYFQGLSQSEDEQKKANRLFEWNLGLFLAKQLLDMLKSDSPHIYDLQSLVNILEVNINNFGSGWVDLYCQAKHFLEFIQAQQLKR
jgi:hypothetical protein